MIAFDRVVELKEAVRWAATPKLAAAFGVGYDPASPLQLSLLFANPKCASEHHSVLSRLLPHASQSMKRKREAQGQAQVSHT